MWVIPTDQQQGFDLLEWLDRKPGQMLELPLELFYWVGMITEVNADCCEGVADTLAGLWASFGGDEEGNAIVL